MKKLYYLIAVIFTLNLVVTVAWAAKSDCGEQPNVPPIPIQKVAKNDPNVKNDYDKEVKEDTRPGVVYLAPIGGAQPKANACGLKASNPADEMAGWGGPLDGENMTIGEGPGMRNEIVIGGTYFERGFGTHAPAKFVFPLTGDSYTRLECYVGMSDEKDPDDCDHGGSSTFIFTVDGKKIIESPVLKGTEDGKDVDAFKIAFDIPSGAKELLIEVTDGGDGNSCDHSAIGDAKLFTTALTPVSPEARLSTTWGELKEN